MLDYIIKGGQVVTPGGVGTWDVGIRGEKIVAIAEAGTLTDVLQDQADIRVRNQDAV